MIKIKCPCCGYLTQTIDYEGQPLFEICDVCFWQYDEVAHDEPDRVIGANHISLNDAKENYKSYGVCKKQFKHHVRQPLPEEFPENNATAYEDNQT